MFVATLAVLSAASFLPNARLWGLAPWAHFPLPVVIGTALFAVVGVWMSARAWFREPAGIPSRRTTATVTLISLAVTAVLFTVLRTKAHFLGDGYTALSLLAGNRPLIKSREIGESLLHVWVKNLSGLEGEPAALLSFRVLSIAAGVIFTGVLCWASARLFPKFNRRLVFVVGMLTGGYALLFFGYVENYSLFVASVGCYALVGLLVARNRLARGWLLIPASASVFFHVLGVTLIPSLVYLILAPTRAGQRMRRWNTSKWAALGIIMAIPALWALVYAWSTSTFFRYSLIAPLPDKFTVGGYTLLSGAHLLDIANLLVLLLPGAGLLILALIRAAASRSLSNRSAIFLIVLSISSAGAVFVFDPKLGMPRDWDLFSFAGVGPVALFYLLTLDESFKLRSGMRIAVAGLVLALVSLSGRVAMVNNPKILIARFKDYLTLDPLRDRNGPYLLLTYYEKQGDSTAVQQVRAEWQAAFPIKFRLERAMELKDAGKITEAGSMLEEIVREDPAYGNAWSNLGEITMRAQNWDSAMYCLNMAIGLNPFDAAAYSNRGVVRLYHGQPVEAVDDLEQALAIDPTKPAVLFNLASANRKLGRIKEAEEQIALMAAGPDLAAYERTRLFQWYAESRRTGPAVEQIRAILDMGMDTAYVARLVQPYPALRTALQKELAPRP